MPYIIVRGNLLRSEESDPWKVFVSGLKAVDVDDLKRFKCGGYIDEYTITYFQHPCVILSALEVLGYEVIVSSTTKSNEYIWTMKKDFSEPEPTLSPKSVIENKIPMLQNEQSADDGNKQSTDFIALSEGDDVKLHLIEQLKKPKLFDNFGKELSKETKKAQILYKLVTDTLNEPVTSRENRMVSSINSPLNEDIMEIIFEWAIREPYGYKKFALISSVFCSKQDFQPMQRCPRSIIITKCQILFEKFIADESKLTNKEHKMGARFDPEFQQRSINTCKLIGELYNLRMLTTKIILRCIKQLITVNELLLECLYALINVIQNRLCLNIEPGPLKIEFVHYLRTIQSLIDKEPLKISPTIRSMLIDIINSFKEFLI